MRRRALWLPRHCWSSAAAATTGGALGLEKSFVTAAQGSVTPCTPPAAAAGSRMSLYALTEDALRGRCDALVKFPAVQRFAAEFIDMTAYTQNPSLRHRHVETSCTRRAIRQWLPTR